MDCPSPGAPPHVATCLPWHPRAPPHAAAGCCIHAQLRHVSLQAPLRLPPRSSTALSHVCFFLLTSCTAPPSAGVESSCRCNCLVHACSYACRRRQSHAACTAHCKQGWCVCRQINIMAFFACSACTVLHAPTPAGRSLLLAGVQVAACANVVGLLIDCRPSPCLISALRQAAAAAATGTRQRARPGAGWSATWHDALWRVRSSQRSVGAL